MKEIAFVKKIIEFLKGLSTTQIAVAGTATALCVAGVIGGVAFSNTWKTSGNDLRDTEGTEVAYSTESLFPVVGLGETEETEETETVEVSQIYVKISTTSIEKDLKVKITDENGDLVKGFPFVVALTPKDGGEEKTYNDHDMDGIIHIQDLEGGDYIVVLQELEGIIAEENEITATVKGQISYQKVEIENEIVNESQINVSVEDTGTNNVAVEAPIVDTTALLESSVSTTVVPKENVDLTKFPAAIVSQEKNIGTIQQTRVEIISSEEEESTEGLEGVSVGTSGQTQTIVVASATVSIPKMVTLYTVGSEASLTADISLEIEDANQLIRAYTWSIKDAAVAELTVGEDQKTAKLKALAEGKTTIVISFEYVSDVDNNTIATYELICDVEVSKHTDAETQLVDIEGKLLYLDNQAKEIATAAGYEAAAEFYSEPKYTGWQTVNGYLYYYTAENVPATGSQIIGGVTYEFHEDGTLKENQQSTGIDVSKWQGKIDWPTVASAGIDFAIIRCAYRGASTGVIVEDPYFKANIKGAVENGIKVGVYFFTQAITQAEAVEEASTAISLVSGYKLQFPIFIDTEGATNGRANGLNKADRTAIVKAFCETVRNSGYKSGIYASKYWYYDNLDVSQLSTYNIWVAQYNTVCNYSGRYDMWQYTSSGSVPGIKGNVDMNICYTKY